MKVVLAAINAKYIHSNLAVYSLRAYASKYKEQIELAEYTINNYADDILMGIYEKKPDIVAFSCYIWNINMVFLVAEELRKVLPETKIWLGGPEVTYDVERILRKHPYIDGIMVGEGEQTFYDLMTYYQESKVGLEKVKGISYRESAQLGQKNFTAYVGVHDHSAVTLQEEAIISTPPQLPMNMDQIPFVYEDMKDFKNKIIYYETSRGCPYSCSYCLSSIDKKVRLRSTELVKKELLFFIEQKVPQVKFVDRTFNCNRRHTMEILKFIKEHDQGITNFHFEVSADILNDEEIEMFNSLRPGLVQLEIGVQSTNSKTIEAIRRKMDFDKLSGIVKRIYEPRNIHQHLDLIVGLPYEDIESFKSSFNDVYQLRPDQLQVGFLKVLAGSYMVEQSRPHGIVYKSYAPYEVLKTNYISYDEVLKLKQITDMVEIYYNSLQFTNSIRFLEHYYETPFVMFEAITEYCVREGIYGMSQSRINRYVQLLQFFQNCVNATEQERAIFSEILLYDLYLREKLKSRPAFAKNTMLEKKKIRHLLELNREFTTDVSLYHIEEFSFDLQLAIETGEIKEKRSYIFFDYDHRDRLSHDATDYIMSYVEEESEE